MTTTRVKPNYCIIKNLFEYKKSILVFNDIFHTTRVKMFECLIICLIVVYGNTVHCHGVMPAGQCCPSHQKGAHVTSIQYTDT